MASALQSTSSRKTCLIDHSHDITASEIWAKFEAAQDHIESSLNIFLAATVLNFEDGEELDAELEDAVSARNGRLTFPSWSVLANDLLLDGYITHTWPFDTGSEEDVETAFHDFCMEVGTLSPTPESQDGSTEEDDGAEGNSLGDAMTTSDMYDFVERNIGTALSRARDHRISEGGCLLYIAQTLHSALKVKECVTKTALNRVEGLPPRHAFFIVLRNSRHLPDGVEGFEDLMPDLHISEDFLEPQNDPINQPTPGLVGEFW